MRTARADVSLPSENWLNIVGRMETNATEMMESHVKSLLEVSNMDCLLATSPAKLLSVTNFR